LPILHSWCRSTILRAASDYSSSGDGEWCNTFTTAGAAAVRAQQFYAHEASARRSHQARAARAVIGALLGA
jgi:hypothetical protein